MILPDLKKITAMLRSIPLDSESGESGETTGITQGISMAASVSPLSHYTALAGETDSADTAVSPLSHQEPESGETGQHFDIPSVERYDSSDAPVSPSLIGVQTSNALFLEADAPLPLTPHSPCVVCAGTDRWDDAGVWRCRACCPEPASRAARQAAALERMRAQAPTRTRMHTKPRDKHLGPLLSLCGCGDLRYWHNHATDTWHCWTCVPPGPMPAAAVATPTGGHAELATCDSLREKDAL
jgi:hypothetical protein